MQLKIEPDPHPGLLNSDAREREVQGTVQENKIPTASWPVAIWWVTSPKWVEVDNHSNSLILGIPRTLWLKVKAKFILTLFHKSDLKYIESCSIIILIIIDLINWRDVRKHLQSGKIVHLFVCFFFWKISSEHQKHASNKIGWVSEYIHLCRKVNA